MLQIGLSTSFGSFASNLSAFDQVVAQPQRRCVRSEDLRFIGIDTELHYPYPVGCSSFVLASTSCTPPVAMLLLPVVAVAVSVSRGNPPDVVLQREAVAMCTNVRQGDSSHSINWRAMIRRNMSVLFSEDFLLNAQTTNVILCHFLFFEGPLTKLSFLPIFLPSNSIAILHCEVGTTQCQETAFCIRASF